MKALIDGDIIVHRVGFTTENEDLNIAKWRASEMLDGILDDTGSENFQIYLSDSTENGFRQEFYPQYKANRVAPKPRHYNDLKEFLISEWGARITLGQEADDALGIEQTTMSFHHDAKTWFDEGKSVICSIDKDLLQIPGFHWNFVRKEFTEVSYFDGLVKFYTQLLTGDTSDNVKGVKGIGAVKAGRLLSELSTEEALFKTVWDSYWKWQEGQEQEEVAKLLLSTGRVLKIRQQEGEIWGFPQAYKTLEPTPADESLSTHLMQGESSPSTEPTKQDQTSG